MTKKVCICLFPGRSAGRRLNRDEVVCKRGKDFTAGETITHAENWIPLLRKSILVGRGDFLEECG